MPVPSFNSVQPGETYYYNEAVGNEFGVVDSSGKDEHEHLLMAFFYMEEDSKKGGNNVASILIDYLHQNDRIPSTTPGAEPPRDAKDSGSARPHSTHPETSSTNRP